MWACKTTVRAAPVIAVMAALGELAAYRTGDKMAGFTQESLPRATLEVRQGVGRLIRSVSDWGAVVLCDSRLTSARYGRGVIASLGMPAQVHSLAAVEAWFSSRKSTNNAPNSGAQP